MTTATPARGHPGYVVGAGLAATALFVAAGLYLMETRTFDTWGAFLLAPILVVVSLPALRREASRQGDRRLFLFLLAVLLLKLAGAVVRHYVTFEVYEKADATGYDDWGVRLSGQFRAGNFDTGLDTLTDTNFVRLLTGIVYTVIGPTKLGGFLVFSWLGFWGLFLFYRAFVVAVPEGRKGSYARLLFLLPTLVYWPSGIGKESWMTLALGVASFGAARMMTGATARGLVGVGLGTWMAGILRPHIAAMVVLAIAVAYVLRKQKAHLRHLAPVAKTLSLLTLLLLAWFVLQGADDFLRNSGVPTNDGLGAALGQLSERTEIGRSKFAPSVLDSPFRAPMAFLTVLFRPFPFEAHNVPSLVTSLEAGFLLCLSLARFRSIVAAVGSVRRQPYVAFAVAFILLFVVGFSGIANFGLLVRQRVQVFPMWLILLAVPPPGRRSRTALAPETPKELVA